MASFEQEDGPETWDEWEGVRYSELKYDALWQIEGLVEELMRKELISHLDKVRDLTDRIRNIFKSVEVYSDHERHHDSELKVCKRYTYTTQPIAIYEADGVKTLVVLDYVTTKYGLFKPQEPSWISAQLHHEDESGKRTLGNRAAAYLDGALTTFNGISSNETNASPGLSLLEMSVLAVESELDLSVNSDMPTV